MRLPSARLTMRQAIAIAAVTAVLLGGGLEVCRRRARTCSERIAYHAAERRRLTADREVRLREAETDPSLRAALLFDADRHRQAIAWHADREAEFRKAKWRPWQPVPREPTGPPWPPIPTALYPVTRPDPHSEPGRPGTPLLNVFLFHPWRFPQGDWAIDPGVEDVWFRSSDGVRLNGWYTEAAQPHAVVLYTEGNAGNITGRRWVLGIFRNQLRCSVFVFDYRGYGRSEGSPSIPGVLADARAARRWLARRARVAERDIVLVGRSLGGAVAVDLAGRDGARGLVLESTFSSLADVAEHHFGRAGRILATDKLDSVATIRGYRGPLLQTHGDADDVVPYELGRRLFKAANEPKRFIAVPDGDHNDPIDRKYLKELDRFLGAPPELRPGQRARSRTASEK